MTDRRRPGDSAAIARSAEAKAIHPAAVSGLLGRGACHRAAMRATCWRAMTLANIVARMERSEIRDSRDVDPGFRCASSGLQPLDLPVGRFADRAVSLISDFPKNIFVPTPPKSILELSLSRPTEGRIAIVTDAGWDAVDAAAFCARRD